MNTSKLEKVHINNKDWMIYGVLPLGDDHKYLLIPVCNEVTIDKDNQPVNSKGEYIGTWTNQLAIDYARKNLPKQLSIDF